jgi:hypothetical protein
MQSGILDRTKLVSNILLILLVAGNIFFSIQYIETIKQQSLQEQNTTDKSIEISRFLKLFINVVLDLDSNESISYDDRLNLENSIRSIKDVDLLRQWNAFVDSADANTAQKNAIILMKELTNKLIIK